MEYPFPHMITEHEFEVPDFRRRVVPTNNVYSSWVYEMIMSMLKMDEDERQSETPIIHYIRQKINKPGIGPNGSRVIRWPIRWMSIPDALTAFGE